MNEKQKMVLIAMAVVILGMLVYPPFLLRWGQGRVVSKGYGWIVSPPDGMATVDIGVLLTQWFAVFLVGDIVWFMLKDR